MKPLRSPVAAAPFASSLAEKAGLPSWVEETGRLPSGFTNRQPALPFGAEPSTEFVEALSAPPDAELPPWSGETVALPLEPGAVGGALPFPEQSAPVPTAMPPQGKASVGLSVAGAVGVIEGMNVQQYASLRVELAVFPEHSVATLARYGVRDEAAQRRLNEVWAERFLKDPALRQTWMGLFTGYRDWLLQTKR